MITPVELSEAEKRRLKSVWHMIRPREYTKEEQARQDVRDKDIEMRKARIHKYLAERGIDIS